MEYDVGTRHFDLADVWSGEKNLNCDITFSIRNRNETYENSNPTVNLRPTQSATPSEDATLIGWFDGGNCMIGIKDIHAGDPPTVSGWNVAWGTEEGGNVDYNGDVYTYIVANESSGRIPLRYGRISIDSNGCDIEIEADFPIFDTEAHANAYILTGDMTGCLNYGEQYSNLTEDYYIYNTYDSCNIKMGIVTYTGGSPTGRFEIFKANSRPAFYYVNKQSSCELVLLASGIVGSVYDSINKQRVIDKQDDPDAWTEGRLVYTGPFYNVLDYLPDGSYTVGVTFDTNIPIFENETKARGFIEGTVPEEESLNYGTIGKPSIASNQTGTKELTTTFGGNESENVFSHDYLMNHTELADIGGKFFDTSVIQAILDGLKLYGNNPMDSVLSCLYFPFDLSTICPNATSVTDIYFGSYKMENVSARKVKTRSGYKELGSTFIKPTFYNWLDYEAMHIYLYLPYVGFVELDVNKYLNKWLKIIYMIDLHSGEAEVSLTADGLLMDTYSGQIGIKQPLTYNDLATYFQSQITALRNGVMSSVGLVGCDARLTDGSIV